MFIIESEANDYSKSRNMEEYNISVAEDGGSPAE